MRQLPGLNRLQSHGQAGRFGKGPLVIPINFRVHQRRDQVAVFRAMILGRHWGGQNVRSAKR